MVSRCSHPLDSMAIVTTSPVSTPLSRCMGRVVLTEVWLYAILQVLIKSTGHRPMGCPVGIDSKQVLLLFAGGPAGW
jgi:hypothetical protein